MTTKFLTGGALAALAAALAFTAVPASAQDRHDHGHDRSAHNEGHGGWNSGDRHDEHAAPARSGWNNGAQTQRTYTPPVSANRGQWTQRNDNQRVEETPRTTTRLPGWGDGPRTSAGERNRTYSDPNRNQTYVDPHRNSTYSDQHRYDRSDNDRNWQSDRHDNDRHWRNDGDDRQQWNRDWRNNNRYDWQRYRSYNRNIYHLRPYYAPYRGYSYRRLGIGFYLDPLFFGQQYWIADPWQYRLPDEYGPYRWVRYYDDAVLVNIYTGEVVDVIHDFFW